MEKLEIIRIAVEVVGGALLMFLGAKNWKYRAIIAKIYVAAKDLVVTEQEFQDIIDEVKKEIWKDEDITVSK